MLCERDKELQEREREVKGWEKTREREREGETAMLERQWLSWHHEMERERESARAKEEGRERVRKAQEDRVGEERVVHIYAPRDASVAPMQNAGERRGVRQIHGLLPKENGDGRKSGGEKAVVEVSIGRKQELDQLGRCVCVSVYVYICVNISMYIDIYIDIFRYI